VRKAWIVARHEFLTTVKRVWFVVVTFVLPLVFGGLGYGMSQVAEQAVVESQAAVRTKPMGYIDQWGEMAPKDGFRKFDSEQEAKDALLAKTIGSYVIVSKDYLRDGKVEVFTTRRPTALTARMPPLPSGVHDWFLGSVLKDIRDPQRIERAKKPFDPEPRFLDETGQISHENFQETEQRAIAAYAFFVLLLTSIFTSSAYLLQGMAEEKENRVLEMVLSSIKPHELMLGKLIGLGGAGLLQMTIWVTMSMITVIALAVQFVISPAAFTFCFVYYLLGYILYGSLMLGFGSLGTNLRESQQMASIWSFIGASPAMIAIALFEAPQGTIARIFSYVPFTAPTTMMFRYVVDPKGTPIYDIVASMALLIATTWLAIRVSARLYRAGLLLYGKRPGVREIWRWIVDAR
jgi:ABC-2 type transport system permease protein